MGRDKDYPNEYTKEIQQNAIKLLAQVNALLQDLGIKNAKVSSGWRPAAINAGVANAAKKSAHMTGEAVDIKDDADQNLCKKITEELLDKYDLYMENPGNTRGSHTNWCHLQTRPTRSGRRVFFP